MVLTRTDLEDIKRIIGDEVRSAVKEQLEKIDKKYGDIIKNLQLEINNQATQIKKLQDENQLLSKAVDNHDQLLRKHNLRIFGLATDHNENISCKVLDLFNKTMQLRNISQADIVRCHRVQPRDKTTNKIPAVLVEFVDANVRSSVFKNVKYCKNSSISIREDLTKRRINIVTAAVKKFSPKSVWTKNGYIYVKCAGVIHRIDEMKDLDAIATDLG